MTDRRRLALLATVGGAVLVAAVAWVYWPTLGNGLVWDDLNGIVAARPRRGFGWPAIHWAFTSFVLGHYQPLTWLSFAVDERLWGTRPIGYHVTNLVLHAVNTLLVALVALLVFDRAQALQGGAGEGAPDPDAARRRGLFAAHCRSLFAALLAAAIFALHPLRVESVAWATERRDVLSAFFFLLSTIAYLKREAAESPTARRNWYGAAFAACLLGLLAKAQVAFPAVLLVLDFWPLGKLTAADGRLDLRAVFRAVVDKLRFFALSAAFSVSAIRAQASTGALLTTQAHSLFARLVQTGYGLYFYLRSAFAGSAWYPLYERPVPLDPREPRYLLPALAGFGITALIFAGYRRRPALAAAWAVYVVLLLPVLGLTQSGVQLVADRYTYLACVGWAMLLAWGVSWAAGSRRPSALRWATLVLALVTLAAWAGLSRRQTAVWHDEETFWHHTLAGGPSGLAHLDLGILLRKEGLIDAAAEQLVDSLDVVPSYNRPWTSLETLLEKEGDQVSPETAQHLLPTLSKALAHHADVGLTHYIVGMVLVRAGKDELALGAFTEALRLDPKLAPAAREQKRLKEKLGG